MWRHANLGTPRWQAMRDPFQFRCATVSDAGAISRLILDMAASVTADPAGGGAAPFLATLTPEAIAAKLCSQRFRYHLAWEGGVLAGVIGIRDASHLFHLFVSPAHQHRGLGTRLWQLGREAALAAGNPGHFTVNATPGARPLYERFGFRECGEPIQHNGVRAVPMEWRGGQEGEGEVAAAPAGAEVVPDNSPDNSVHPETRAEWRAWLEAQQQRRQGVWLISWRKASGRTPLSYEEAVEEALCFGWVDSKPGKVDEVRTRLWFAPRKAGTGWSRPNKERVERLRAAGRMAPAGLAKVEAALADGSWTALDGVENLEIPPDLAEALAALPHARAHFDAFPRSVKRGILEWILTAKRPATRASRIEETAQRAALNERANQWRGPKR